MEEEEEQQQQEQQQEEEDKEDQKTINTKQRKKSSSKSFWEAESHDVAIGCSVLGLCGHFFFKSESSSNADGYGRSFEYRFVREYKEMVQVYFRSYELLASRRRLGISLSKIV